MDSASIEPEREATRDLSDQITLACCVEYGTLEEGAIRLGESLRRFGGRLANARLVAVTPRPGPSLRPATLKRFAELNVEHVRLSPNNRYDWQPYLNKYFALKEAERLGRGDLVAWVDSDVIVLKEPTSLLLPDDADFGACARDKNVGSSGPDDPHEPYWRKICESASLQPDDLPWVTTVSENERIRLYWNAGIFVYRKGLNIIDKWKLLIEKILDDTDKTNLAEIFWADQAALSLAIVNSGVRYENLSGSMNYGIATHFNKHLTSDGLGSAELLHYHDSMKPENWEWFLQTIEESLPEANIWLRQEGPIYDTRTPGREAVKAGYRVLRQIRRRLWSMNHGAGLLGR